MSCRHIISEMEEVMDEKAVIFEYVKERRHRRNNKVGVLLGVLDKDNTVKIGWSKCNIKDGDIFDAKEGMDLAYKRAQSSSKWIRDTRLPDCIKKQTRKFGARCLRYFKEANKLELPS